MILFFEFCDYMYIYKLAEFTVINIYITHYKHNVGEYVAIYTLHH